jgi:hypothetical protein
MRTVFFRSLFSWQYAEGCSRSQHTRRDPVQLPETTYVEVEMRTLSTTGSSWAKDGEAERRRRRGTRRRAGRPRRWRGGRREERVEREGRVAPVERSRSADMMG